jgi:hypothetical protein
VEAHAFGLSLSASARRAKTMSYESSASTDDFRKKREFYMYSLITKSAVLLSILTLLSLVNASADLKKVPLILMDTGTFGPDPNNPNNPNFASLQGDGASTHLGAIVSTGLFEKTDRPSGGFKGKIEGTATAAPAETATATSSETATATSKPDSITYRLSAEFRPDASGIFYGIGTYVITGGTGKFKRARGFGEFIGLANLTGGTYNCFLRGVTSY